MYLESTERQLSCSLPYLPGWERMRTLLIVSLCGTLDSSPVHSPFPWCKNIKRKFVHGTARGRDDTIQPNAGLMVLQIWSKSCCWQRERDDCQRHAVHYGRVLIFTQLSQLLGSSVVLLLQGDKINLLLFVLCLQWSEQGGRKRKVHCSALCPRGGRSSASCKNVSNVSGKRSWEWWPCHCSRKAQSHLCHAFQSVLISTRNWVTGINHVVTSNINTVAKRIN